MTDPQTTPEMEAYVGKTFGVDFTEDDIQAEFPEYSVRVLNLTTLALATFNPDRLRVWLDADGKVAKVITG